MTDSQVVLSFAEVAFLMALNADVAGNRACALLGVPVVAVGGAVAQAGLASLALRGLARQEQSGLALAPQVAAVAQGLVTPQSIATVATVAEDGDTIVQLMVGKKQSLSIRPMALGCFQFDGLRASCKLEDLVVSLLTDSTDTPFVAARLNELATITVRSDGKNFTLNVDGEPPRLIPVEDLAAEARSTVRAALKRSK